MRLLTRSDFDGLICAVLLKEAGVMDSWKFVHPKDVQEGLIEVTEDDILANVPYTPGVGLWFDHHSSEQERLQLDGRYDGASRNAPSAARVIFDYYGPEKFFGFGDMLHYVDKVDSGRLTEDEILNPTGWVLLGFICVNLFYVSGLMCSVVILDSAMPSAANTAILAMKYNNESELISSVVFVTTIASLVVIPFLLKVLS